MKNRSKRKDRMRLELIQECITKSNNQFNPEGYILKLVNIILDALVDFFINSLFIKNENKYKKELQNYTNWLLGLYSNELYGTACSIF